MSETQKFWLFALLLYLLFQVMHNGCGIRQLDDRLNRMETHLEIPAESPPADHGGNSPMPHHAAIATAPAPPLNADYQAGYRAGIRHAVDVIRQATETPPDVIYSTVTTRRDHALYESLRSLEATSETVLQ